VHAVVPRGNYTYRVRLASDRWASTNLTLNQSYVLTSPVFDEVVGQIDLTTSKPFYVGKSESISFNASSLAVLKVGCTTG
jgi:hypothetical protein